MLYGNCEPPRPENQALEAGLLANGIYRGDKHTIYEGGSRVPLIVRWDGKVAAATVNDRMVNIVDLYATLVEGVSGGVPTADEAPDSISFLPSLQGEKQPARPAMITTNVAGIQALRDGKWKFIDGKFPDAVPEGLRRHVKVEAEPALYNLDTDPAETKNLFAEHPEIVERMQVLLDNYREQGSTR